MVFTLKRWLLRGLPSDRLARTWGLLSKAAGKNEPVHWPWRRLSPKSVMELFKTCQKIGGSRMLPTHCRGFLGASNNWAVIKATNITIANCNLPSPPPTPHPYSFNKTLSACQALYVFACIISFKHPNSRSRNCDFLHHQRGWELTQDDRTEKWWRQTKVIWVPSPSCRENLRWLGFKLWMDLT